MHSMKSVSLRCGEVKSLANASNIFINGTIFRIANPSQLKGDIMKTDVNQLCRHSHQNISDNKVEKRVQSTQGFLTVKTLQIDATIG